MIWLGVINNLGSAEEIAQGRPLAPAILRLLPFPRDRCSEVAVKSENDFSYLFYLLTIMFDN